MPRITGHSGAVYLGTPLVKVADTYNWTMETTAKVERASVKGDKWERKMPGRGDATITVDAYISTGALLSREIFDAVNTQERLQFRLDAIDANGSFQQITGYGYISRGTIGMPHDDKATDSVEITLDGEPAFS